MQLGEEEPRHAPVVRLASTFPGVHLIGSRKTSSMRKETAEARIAINVARLLQTPRALNDPVRVMSRLIAAGTTAAKDSRTAAGREALLTVSGINLTVAAGV
jgi:hypothetical protein